MPEPIELSTVEPIWTTWAGEARSQSRYVYRPVRYIRHTQRRVRVLPGNPSLPLRVMLKELSTDRNMRPNGGLNGSPLGIDLELRGHEVRKLIYAGGGFTSVLAKEGIDIEDFIQELFRAILVRNRGTCRWDHKKSSMGHMVHLIARCVISNMLRRDRRRTSIESLTENGDAPELLVGTDDEEVILQREDLLTRAFPMEEEQQRAGRFLMLLEAGYSRRDALETLEESATWGDGVIRKLREKFRE